MWHLVQTIAISQYVDLTPTFDWCYQMVKPAVTTYVTLLTGPAGGNLPFRRLCCDFDAQLPTMSEMAFARKLVK
jgi:hypothetical protein